jgi:hypothetical protein
MDSQTLAWVDFEDEVFRYVRAWLNAGQLSVNAARATIHRKKSYYSAARRADIEFEVAIEAFDDGATEPSVVWVWECKDRRKNGRRVEVSDVEALNDKITQLGQSRFKGSLVTTNGFQSGALERAKSCGINLFVLQKELVRVTLYGRDEMDRWDEKLSCPVASLSAVLI